MSLIYDTVFPPQPEAPIKPEARPLPKGLEPHVQPLLPCKRCNGAGHTLSKGFACDDGKRFPSTWKTCISCDGTGWYHAPDLTALVAAVKGRKGLRSKRPAESRAYYVWRLARFHGGADTCLPMGAEMELGDDPYRSILDELARIVARRVYGSGNYGTARWHQAMYGSHDFKDVPADLTMMPVYDASKPKEEMLETM